MADKKCKICNKWLSVYNNDSRCLCFDCIRKEDSEKIKSPAAESDAHNRMLKMMRAARFSV